MVRNLPEASAYLERTFGKAEDTAAFRDKVSGISEEELQKTGAKATSSEIVAMADCCGSQCIDPVRDLPVAEDDRTFV